MRRCVLDVRRPHRTEWHFAAGLNVSNCAGKTVGGDHNGMFSRLRLLSMLRLLRHAAGRLHARGTLGDVELVVCANEVRREAPAAPPRTT